MSLPVSSRSTLCAAVLVMVGLGSSAAAPSADPLPVGIELHRVPALQRSVLAADLDGDGHVDLVGGSGQPATLHIARGLGGGTFGTATPLGVTGEPAALADINGNGRLDLVVRQPDRVVILPGLGNASFGAPRLVHAEAWAPGNQLPYHFALVADFSGNGHADLAIPTFAQFAPGILVFAGNGDFTFQPPVLLPMASWPVDAAAGDFTGDGRPDIAATEVCCSVTVFRNDGGLLFTQSSIALARDLSGIAAGDLDGDGHLDLVVAEFFDWETIHTEPNDTRGEIAVLLGRGDGTFETPARYNSGVRGETMVVIGDFTRDGVPDVATGNRSYFRHDDLGIQMWDSVTIFPGTGTGALASPVTFALDTSGALYDPSPYAATIHRLVAADLDGDGFPDLVSSPAAVLLTRPGPDPHSLPTVSAGPSRTVHHELPVTLHAQADHPDHRWLTFEWFRDEDGRRIAWWPIAAASGPISGLDPGRHTFTVVVEDLQGNRATDTVTILSVDPSFRSGWTSGDIGATARPGHGAYDSASRTFTVSASGADIWGIADAFHYLSQPIAGSFRIVARVASIEHVHRWTKAGLMIRESLAPGARHASVFATPTTERPVAFQRRTTTGGASVHTDGPFVGPPVWIALTRAGDEITAQFRIADTDPWVTFGRDTLPNLSDEVYMGLAVTSHDDGRLATATFDSLHVELLEPSVLVGRDIGVVSAPGSSTFADGTATVTGSGADIWGTADAFHYLHQRVGGDFQVVTRVASVDNVHRWTKAGLMIRQSELPGSRHASIFATPTTERPVAFQRRPTHGGESVHTGGAFVGPPVWLSLTRVGDRITAHYRLDGASDWVLAGTQTLQGLPHDVLVGLAVTSHLDGVLATAVFEHYRVTPFIAGPETPAFASQDIGAVSASGSSTIAGDLITVRGSGADIWGTADAFHYVHRPITGDFQIRVRAATVQHVERWTKAGLMIRETLSPGSRHASIFATPTTERPVAFQRRPTTGGQSVHSAGAFIAPPVWLALSRTGDTITAHYRVADAGDWIPIGSQTLPGLPAQVHVGLAVTSHRDGTIATATFDGLLIGGGE